MNRIHQAESAGDGWNRNTDLCVDVKTFLRTDRTARLGKDYPGILRRDMEGHYSFVETIARTSTAGKRTPHVFEGRYITVTRRDDGTYRPNFKPIKEGKEFDLNLYAIGVMGEIRQAFEGLLGENSSSESNL